MLCQFINNLRAVQDVNEATHLFTGDEKILVQTELKFVALLEGVVMFCLSPYGVSLRQNTPLGMMIAHIQRFGTTRIHLYLQMS